MYGEGIQTKETAGKHSYDDILTPEAIEFVSKLERQFGPERRKLLELRKERQARIDAGELPDFFARHRHIRSGEWKIAPIPQDLTDRRVEITGCGRQENGH